MNQSILTYHINQIINFIAISIISSLLVAVVLVLNTDITNNSYIDTTKSTSIAKNYIITSNNGIKYKVDIKEKDILNRDFVNDYEIQFDNINESINQFSIVQYFNNIFHYKFKTNYTQEIKQTNFLLSYFVFVAVFAKLLYRYIKYVKYNLLPRHFNFYNVIGSNEKQSKQYDKFVKKIDNKIIYKNSSKINFDKYIQNLEDIKQYLKLNNLEIERYKNNAVALVVPLLPSILNFDITKLQKDKIYMGIDKNLDDCYWDMDNMTHFINTRSTGAGKSVYIQNFLLSLFYNHNKIDKFYLIDPKRAEFGRYKKLKKVIYADTEALILQVLKDFQKSMYARFSEMETDNLDSGNTKYNGNFKFLIMDEFGTLGTISDSKIKKEIEKILIDCRQKSRRSKQFMVFVGQKATSDNIPSNVLTNILSRGVMKTDDNDNISKMVGNKSELQEQGINPKEFIKGRLYFKNGDNGVNKLLQVPYFNLEDSEHLGYLKEIVKDLIIPIENEPIAPTNVNYDLEIKDLWDKTKTLEDTNLASHIRKEIQALKRGIKTNSITDIPSTINHIETLFK